MTTSKIDNIVAGATPEIQDIIVPTSDVSESGGGDAFTNADIAQIVSPNAIIKFCNIRIQAAILDGGKPCWLEYALVMFEEQQTTPTVDALITANRATKTIPQMCRNLYRGKTIWNDAIPVHDTSPKTVNIAIKIPNKYCKWIQGRYFCLIVYLRPANAADGTSQCGYVTTTQFKAYM